MRTVHLAQSSTQARRPMISKGQLQKGARPLDKTVWTRPTFKDIKNWGTGSIVEPSPIVRCLLTTQCVERPPRLSKP